MFQQTFIETPESSRKPFSMGLSLLLQAAVIALLALIPLLYSPSLPVLQLRSLILAPPPPTTPVATRAVVPAGRIPTSHRFVFHPNTMDLVPRPVSKEVEVASAPGIDIAGIPGEPNGATSSILGAFDVGPAPAPSLVIKPPAVKPVEKKPLRLGGTVAEANLIQKVQPLYPPLARSARVSGNVEFSAIISRDGLIENLQLLHGHPLLVNAAKQAILQWRYKPTLLNGQPVEVLTNIVVTFTLN